VICSAPSSATESTAVVKQLQGKTYTRIKRIVIHRGVPICETFVKIIKKERDGRIRHCSSAAAEAHQTTEQSVVRPNASPVVIIKAPPPPQHVAARHCANQTCGALLEHYAHHTPMEIERGTELLQHEHTTELLTVTAPRGIGKFSICLATASVQALSQNASDMRL